MSDEMKPPSPKRPPQLGSKIPIIRPVIDGYTFLWAHKRVALSLSILPLIALMMAQYIVRSTVPDAPFTAAIFQIPAEFVMGLSSMVFATLVFRQTQISDPDITFLHRDRFMGFGEQLGWLKPLMPAVVAYAFVSYIFSGLFAGIISLYTFSEIDFSKLNPQETRALAEQSATNIYGILILFVAVIWALRFLWLPLIVLTERPIRKTYRSIGGMEGSVIIGVLFILILTMTMFCFSFVLSLILPLTGATSAENLSPFSSFVRDSISNFALIISQFVFVAASIYALNSLKEKPHSNS